VKALSYAGLGALFALGLVLSGMTNPAKILAFLDFGGAFDPSLLGVMASAVAVYGLSYRTITRRPSPLFGGAFEIPRRTEIDARLVLGASLFGVGWGLSGYCPGPAIVSLLALNSATWTFALSMLFGRVIFAWWDRTREPRRLAAA